MTSRIPRLLCSLLLSLGARTCAGFSVVVGRTVRPRASGAAFLDALAPTDLYRSAKAAAGRPSFSSTPKTAPPLVLRRMSSSVDDAAETDAPTKPSAVPVSPRRRRRFRKSKSVAVAMVPPSEAVDVWEALTKARRELLDPGFFRWPPHANLLYPFLPLKDMGERSGSEGEGGDMFEERMLLALERAAERCEPFEVSLGSMGAFGGMDRGVLWLYPKSYRKSNGGDGSSALTEEEDCYFLTADPSEPLIQLHSLLQEQFPMLQDPRQRGRFHPHVTLSHFQSLRDAREAQHKVEQWWESKTFTVSEFYVLRRVGDDGQFEVAATVPLGRSFAAGDASSRRRVRVHDPPLPFPGMPDAEEDWVKEERVKFERWTAERKARQAQRREEEEAAAVVPEVVVPEVPEDDDEGGERHWDAHDVFRHTRPHRRRRLRSRRRR